MNEITLLENVVFRAERALEPHQIASLSKARPRGDVEEKETRAVARLAIGRPGVQISGVKISPRTRESRSRINTRKSPVTGMAADWFGMIITA
jgi:hypothetical protein